MSGMICRVGTCIPVDEIDFWTGHYPALICEFVSW